MVAIPDAFLDLFRDETKAFAHLATLQPDGTPQVTPVWFDLDGGLVRVNTAAGRVKHRNMLRNPQVALAISDPANPYRYVQVRGRIVRSTEEGADAHIDRLAKKYMGVDTYPFRRPGEQRVLFYVEPVSVSTMG